VLARYCLLEVDAAARFNFCLQMDIQGATGFEILFGMRHTSGSVQISGCASVDRTAAAPFSTSPSIALSLSLFPADELLAAFNTIHRPQVNF
jgi:hypothetical protein